MKKKHRQVEENKVKTLQEAAQNIINKHKFEADGRIQGLFPADINALGYALNN